MLEAMSRVPGMMCIGLSVALAGCAAGPRQESLQSSVQAAQGTLAKFQGDPLIEPLLRKNMKEAKAVLIVTPRVMRGVVLTREGGTQKWSGPAFYQVTNIAAAGGRAAGGMGFTTGEQDLELVGLAMNDKALNWLLAPTVPGSGGVSLAEVRGNERPSADMLLFSASQVVRNGARVGQLSHTILSIDKAANQSYYGRAATPADILIKHSVSNPNAEPLRKSVAAAAGQPAR